MLKETIIVSVIVFWNTDYFMVLFFGEDRKRRKREERK